MLVARSNFLVSEAIGAAVKIGAGRIMTAPPNCVLLVTVRMSSEWGRKTKDTVFVHRVTDTQTLKHYVSEAGSASIFKQSN